MVRELGGKAMVSDWSRDDRVLPINSKGFSRRLVHKLLVFESDLREIDKGLFFLEWQVSFLKSLGGFDASLRVFRGFVGKCKLTKN